MRLPGWRFRPLEREDVRRWYAAAIAAEAADTLVVAALATLFDEAGTLLEVSNRQIAWRMRRLVFAGVATDPQILLRSVDE